MSEFNLTRRSLFAGLSAVAATGVASFAQAAEGPPRSMIWTAYDLGSIGYVEASALANALDAKFSSTVRITPSGTSIGRLLPLKLGRADYGLLASEQNFAAEGLFEFAAREWGPQDVRAILGRPSSFGMATGGDTDIQSLADLKGRRVGYTAANPSAALNTDAMLAFAGLTRSDIVVAEFPSYAATQAAFVAGEIDAYSANTNSAALREAESSRGVRWLPMSASDEAGWERVVGVASFFAPIEETTGVSVSPESPANIVGYKYPQLTCYASKDEEEVFSLVKAIDEAFELYKDASQTMPRWQIASAGKAPAGAPFHPGAIRYLKEAGVWTAEDEAWNQARLQRLETVKAAWTRAMEEGQKTGVSDADWPGFWADYRDQA